MVISRLQAKLARVTGSPGESLDEETVSDLLQIMEEEEKQVNKVHPDGSFQQIF